MLSKILWGLLYNILLLRITGLTNMAIAHSSATSTTISAPSHASVSPEVSPEVIKGQQVTWQDYLRFRDANNPEINRCFFNINYLFIEMGQEGLTHAKVSDLFVFLLVFWFSRDPEISAETFGRCLMEKAPQQAAAPDLVLYVGDRIPVWQEGEPRRIDLHQWRVPDLVGEISDTTLAMDLDQKKQLYAALGIPEYWVIDAKGSQVLIFQLQADDTYVEVSESSVLKGLPVTILRQALQKLHQTTNVRAASWLMDQVDRLRAQS
jgi:Uma2 family endonuclease